jgi:hypothetical protein
MVWIKTSNTIESSFNTTVIITVYPKEKGNKKNTIESMFTKPLTQILQSCLTGRGGKESTVVK